MADPSRLHDRQIVLVQALRAIAATMVVAGHAAGSATRLAETAGSQFTLPRFAGGAGVDLFFVISGFIMVYASEPLFGRQGVGREFLRRRLIRIVPLYWACTTLFIVTLVFGSHGAAGLTPGSIAASYGFVPYDTSGHRSGAIFPIFDLGWTLNYEMLFYVIFAAAIGLSRNRAAAASTTAICGLVVLGLLLRPDATALRFWTAPIVLEFALGLGLALLRRRAMVLPLAVRIGIALAALAVLAADPGGLVGAAGLTNANDLSRVLWWGLPTACILGAATLGPDLRDGPVARAFAHLGDASYSLYLTHPFVLIAMMKAWSIGSLGPALGFGPFVVAAIGTAILVAFASFRLFEKPIYTALRQVGRDRASSTRKADDSTTSAVTERERPSKL